MNVYLYLCECVSVSLAVSHPHTRSCANRAQTRRHMDMEGFTADITNLRKMLASIERKLHEMRLVERWVRECATGGLFAGR